MQFENGHHRRWFFPEAETRAFCIFRHMVEGDVSRSRQDSMRTCREVATVFSRSSHSIKTGAALVQTEAFVQMNNIPFERSVNHQCQNNAERTTWLEAKERTLHREYQQIEILIQPRLWMSIATKVTITVPLYQSVCTFIEFWSFSASMSIRSRWCTSSTSISIVPSESLWDLQHWYCSFEDSTLWLPMSTD